MTRGAAPSRPASLGAARPGEAPGAAGLDLADRVLLRGLLAGLALARRSPDLPSYRAAFAIGRRLAAVMPARRALVRANLARVCDWLVAHGRASPAVAAAAGEPARLDELVRGAFGHWVLGYVESALAPRYRASELRERIVPLDPALAAQALTPPPPGGPGHIQLGMHFGSVDLAALYGTRVGGVAVTAPMERVERPLARAWFEQVRRDLGVRIVPVTGAAGELRRALLAGETVGLVADRVIAGSGARVELFGAPARLPVGPAVLAVETGAPIYLQAVARSRPGDWVGHTLSVRAGPRPTRREAISAILEAQARAFERVVAEAPEQWSTLFFPIWDDQRERT